MVMTQQLKRAPSFEKMACVIRLYSFMHVRMGACVRMWRVRGRSARVTRRCASHVGVRDRAQYWFFLRKIVCETYSVFSLSLHSAYGLIIAVATGTTSSRSGGSCFRLWRPISCGNCVLSVSKNRSERSAEPTHGSFPSHVTHSYFARLRENSCRRKNICSWN